MPYGDEIIVMDYGGRNARRLPVVGASASWELNNIGAFSAFTRLEDLRAAGCAGDLKGSWLSWVHEAGAWGGVITGRPITGGVAEIAAEGWAALLRHHPLGDWDRPAAGPAAGLARRGMMAGESDEPHFVTLDRADESGAWVNSRSGGQDLLDDYLPELVDSGALEWVVTPERVLRLGQRLGIDRSRDIRLVEGIEILSAEFADDAYAAVGVAEFQVAVPQQLSYTPQAMIATGTGVTLLSSGGRRKRRKRWRDPTIRHRRKMPRPPAPASGGGTPKPTPLQQPHYLEQLQLRTIPVALTITNRNAAFAHAELGDRVRIVVESAGFSGVFRTLVRGIDAATGELRLAGEAIPDTGLWRGPYSLREKA